MPCANNGHIPESELRSIRPYGRLHKEAAAGWESPGGPADSGLEPTGPELSTYRDAPGQDRTWATYLAGGPLAARPYTSEHGCGKAIDLKSSWMWAWMWEHGAEYGFRKTEALGEPWHWNFVGGGSKIRDRFEPLEKGDRGKRVKKFSRRLAYIQRSKRDRQARFPERKRYLRKPRRKFDTGMRRAVILFQRDHGLKADGVIGPKTASRITATFRRQWEERG
jgi:hypothetical protein